MRKEGFFTPNILIYSSLESGLCLGLKDRNVISFAVLSHYPEGTLWDLVVHL